jgi:hypothetical protein
MIKLATRLGDRMLVVLLRHAEAGACVRNFGLQCGCSGPRAKLIDCNGVCRTTNLAC